MPQRRTPTGTPRAEQIRYRVHMRRAPVAILALAGAACSYIFELPSMSVLPAETDDPTDGGELDGESMADGPPPFDAPPPVPFCETQPTPFLYCSDFDDAPAPDLGSIGAVQTTNGQLLISSAVALSPPRSLLASARGTSSIAEIVHDLGASPDGVTLSFDLLVSAWTTTDALLSGIVLTGPASECLVGLGGTAASWTVTQICSAGGIETARVTNDSASPITPGRWQRFRLGVRFAPTKNVILDIDGARVLEVPGADPIERAPTSMGLGVKRIEDGSVTAFQDNVLVTSP